MNPFDATMTAYQKRARQGFTYHTVSQPIFEQYYASVHELRQYEREYGLDEEWYHVVRVLSRYRYDVAHVPLPFNHSYHRSRLVLDDLMSTVSRVEETRPTLAPAICMAMKCLEYLLESSQNPLLDEMLNTVDLQRLSRSACGIVLAHSRFISPFREFLLSEGISTFEVIDPNVLRRLLFWDRLFYAGAVRDFDDYVFSSPRTHNTEVFGYRWQQGRWEQSGAFLGGIMGKSQTLQRFAGSSLAHTDALTNFDIEAINHLFQDETDEAQHEGPSGTIKTDARLHELFGGKAVLLEVSDRRTNMVIDLDADPDERVRQVADRGLEEGMFIVLRTGERGSYLAPIADQLLGAPSLKYRTILSQWKARLRELERINGTQALAATLTEAGSERASYQNVRNWMSSQSIAPESDEDFRAIAAACGMEDAFGAMLESAQEIRKAHIHAGQWVRRKLLALVQDADIEEIERQGIRQFEIPEFEGAQLTAYRVEGRSDEVSSVSASAIELVFDLDVFTK